MEVKDRSKPTQSTRCECYNNHPSASGRCTCRPVTDPTRFFGEIAICEECRANCPVGAGKRNPTDEIL